MAEIDENVKLIFKGRIDDQVQWNGYRIQLSELDTIISSKTNSWCKSIYHNKKLIISLSKNSSFRSKTVVWN